MELDRNALIVYMYDVYCTEQALDYTNKSILSLKQELSMITTKGKSEADELERLKQENIRKIEECYEEKEINTEFKLKDMSIKNFFFFYLFGMLTILFFLLALQFRNSESIFNMFVISSSIFLMITMIAFPIEKALSEKRKNRGIKAHNKLQRDNIERRVTDIDKHYDEIFNKIKNRCKYEQMVCEEKISQQEEQLKNLKKLRQEIYDSKIVPYQYQDLFSAGYIYKYLITTTMFDYQYIINQLSMERIKNEITKVVEQQKELILIQRKIYSELQIQTGLLKGIKGSLDRFRSEFSNRMDEISSDLKSIHGSISETQNTILNNQTDMYNQYLENAKNNARDRAEANEYLKMIAKHSETTSMFKRAEFLDLKMDRNYSGDY
ncbi:MAG: hypothetical protein IKH75_20550 [Ruminococcus sp.]|nr:hypothetical protein [Ruminococcus sp.]